MIELAVQSEENRREMAGTFQERKGARREVPLLNTHLSLFVLLSNLQGLLRRSCFKSRCTLAFLGGATSPLSLLSPFPCHPCLSRHPPVLAGCLRVVATQGHSCASNRRSHRGVS